MAGKKKEAGSAEMDAVRCRIEQWRKTRAKLSPMPGELWACAVALAQKHGVYATSVALGVAYESLRVRREGVDGRGGSAAVASSHRFIEITPAAATLPTPLRGGEPAGRTDHAGGVVEMTGANGQRLTLRWSGNEPMDLIGLLRECWRAG